MNEPVPADDAEALPVDRLEGRVLVVDAELARRASLKEILTARGCTVLETAGGAQALPLIRTQRPDVVLVAVTQPGGSGCEICQALQSDPLLRGIPVILVAAGAGRRAVERAVGLGAYDCIRQPVSPSELLVRVRNAVQFRRSAEALRAWKQKTARELEIAGALQRKLFAAPPLLTEQFEVRAACRPAPDIGGDFHDILPLAGGGLAVLAGEVAGHGVGPALLALRLKELLAELIRSQAGRGPAAICTELNLRFRRQVECPGVQATLFLGLFDPGCQEWRCLNCGHPAPLQFARRDAAPVLLDQRGGRPLGWAAAPPAAYTVAEEIRLPAAPGAHLFLYTDGLSGARRAAGGVLGVEALGRIVAALLAQPAQPNVPAAALARVLADGYQLDNDDCTALLVAQTVPDEIKLARAIPPDHRQVNELAAECERILLQLGWPDEAATAARLLTMEHGANVVDHGQLPPEAAIHCRLRVSGGTAGLFFRDAGRAWDFDDGLDGARQRAPDAPHGRGLTIIRTIARYRELYRRGAENVAFYVLSSDFHAAQLPAGAP